jgi:DNA polymerase-3 subunit epsilon
MVNKVRTGNFFHTYVNTRIEVPQEAFNIHGISTEFLKDKPIFDHIAQKFLDFIKGGTLVIHNAAFDIKFLNYELSTLGLPMIDMNNVVDSLTIARQKFPGAPASLDALCRRFGIDLSKRTKHGALLDTELLCEVYLELMGGAQTGFGFDAAKKEAKRIRMEASAAAKSKNILPKRHFPVSEDDLKLHREFVTKHIKANSWGY